jgi:Aminoacyl-tRNA editing domain
MGIALTLERFLDGHHAPYDVTVHERTATARQTARACEVRSARLAEGVPLGDGRGYLLAVLPASRRLDEAELARVMDRPVELATEARRRPSSATAPRPPPPDRSGPRPRDRRRRAAAGGAGDPLRGRRSREPGARARRGVPGARARCPSRQLRSRRRRPPPPSGRARPHLDELTPAPRRARQGGGRRDVPSPARDLPGRAVPGERLFWRSEGAREGQGLQGPSPAESGLNLFRPSILARMVTAASVRSRTGCRARSSRPNGRPGAAGSASTGQECRRGTPVDGGSPG